VIVRYLRAPKAPASWPAAPPQALVLRPCAGDEPHLREALMSGVVLRADAPRALVHLVEAEDAAKKVASGVAQMLQTLGIAAKAHLTTPLGINHKASQLACYDAHIEQYGVCVCIDSDVVLMPDTLAALCAPLADPKCGAAWLPFVQSGQPQSLGDRINGAILATSLQAFGVLRYVDEEHFVGKLVAIRPQALRQVGGWHAVEHLLGEDTVLSQKLNAAGWRVRCVPAMGYTLATKRSKRAVFERYARWAMVMRRHRSFAFLSYPLFVAAMPLLLLSWGAIALGMGPRAVLPSATLCSLGIVAARLSISMIGCRQSAKRFDLGAQSLDAVLADNLLLAAFVAASMRRSLVWRGRRLRYRGFLGSLRVEADGGHKPLG
jgi:ceramide glucosyltransferase